jgi:hypothetical protein
MSPGSSKLFNGDARLAVVDETTLEGFVLTKGRGWLSVSSAYIGLDGRRIDEAFAKAAFGAELEAFGSNPGARP